MSIGNTFNKIKESICEGTEVAAKKSEEFVQTSALSLKISSIESKKDDIYLAIGREAYNCSKKNKDIDLYKQLKDYFEEISLLDKEIKSIRKKILSIKSTKI